MDSSSVLFSFFLICLAVVSPNALAMGHDSEIIRISTGEYPPSHSSKAHENGYTNHIVKKAFAAVGKEVEFTFLPWKRAYEEAKIGRFDVSCCWFNSSKREKDFLLSQPVFNEGLYFFHLKSTPVEWKKLSDLSHFRIGGTREYTYGDAFYTAEKKGIIHVDWVNDDVQSLRKMLLGRIDMVPLGRMVGQDLINSHFKPQEADKFTFHPKPLRQSTTMLLVSRRIGARGPYLLELFNKGMKRIQENGEYDDILENIKKGVYSRQVSSHP